MSKFGFFFGGRDVILPGTYARVNADALVSESGVPSRAIAIIATAEGGEVGSATRITNPNFIRAKLVGGVGAKLAEIAFGASGEVQGAADVYLIRVNKAVASTIGLGDATVTSRLNGKCGNAVKVTRTIQGDFSTVKVSHTTLPLEPETFTGLGGVLEITLTAAAIAPTVVVTTSGGITTVTLTNNAIASAYTSEQFQICDTLVDEINRSTQWTARLVGTLTRVPTTDIKARTYALTANKTNLTIGGKAIEYALANSQIVSGLDIPAGTAAAVDTFMAGGNEGPAVTTADYTDALSIAAELEVMAIVCGTGDAAVLSLAATHVNAMSDAKNRKERILVCGSNKSASKSALITEAKALVTGIGGKQVCIVAFEPQLVDATTNKLVTYPSFYTAAMLAGMKAGNEPAFSPTNTKISVFGSAYKFTIDEREDLLESGIITVNFDNNRNGYIVERAVTSYLRENNLFYRLMQGRDIEGWLNKKIRMRLKRYIGLPADQISVTRIVGTVKSVLTEEVRSPKKPEGVLTSGQDPVTLENKPAFENIVADIGIGGYDVVSISYTAHVVGEIGFIAATGFLTPLRIIARAN